MDLNRFVQATSWALAEGHLIVVDGARIRRAEHVGVLRIHERSDGGMAGVIGRLPCLLGELGILAVRSSQRSIAHTFNLLINARLVALFLR